MGGKFRNLEKGEVAGFNMQGLAVFFPVRKVDLVTGGFMWMGEKCMQTGFYIVMKSRISLIGN